MAKDESRSQAAVHQSTAKASTTYAFAPAISYAEVKYETDDVDDEVVIGYATALISCVLSIAIGFGLGYGT